MKTSKKLLAVFLVLAFVFCIAQPAYGLNERGSKTASLAFSVISDIHYYPQSMMGDKGEAWLKDCRNEAKEYTESDALLDCALTAIGQNASKEGTKYLLLPGDLTRNSEYEAHVQLAKRLEAFENEYGIQVITINGNHDIGSDKAATYENNIKEPTKAITAAQFREVYKNLGYDLAVEEFKPTTDDGHGMLSYVVDIDEGYRLIAIDSCVYDPDEAGFSKTEGYISDEQLDWIKEKAAQAKEIGKTPFVMVHHGLAAHMKFEPSITQAFVLNDYMNVAEQLADSGINYAFTGHIHTNDISSVTSDNGNVLYDCETSSLTGFPNQFRNVVFDTYENGETLANFQSYDADCVKPVSVDGKTYPQGEFKYTSFALCFGGGRTADGKPDVAEFLLGMVEGFVSTFRDEIAQAGGILEYLNESFGLDVSEIIAEFLKPYIGDGVGLGGYNIFSADNIVWFVDDLCDQIEELYFNDPDALDDALRPILGKIFSMQVSDVPCTKFIDTYGFGDASRGANLGELVLSAMHYWYTGNEDISDDALLLDAIYQLENGDIAFEMFDTLVDIAFNDLIEGAILSKLEIRVDKLFGQSCVGQAIGQGLNEKVLTHILRGDFSYQNLIDTVFELGALPYSSLFDVVDTHVIQEYLTDSQIESVGHTLSIILEDFATDSVPQKYGDHDVTYSSAKVIPDATKENYRIPTMISVTMGDDSSTSANINWFSKSTLAATDIEIYELDGRNAVFTGKATDSQSVPFNIAKSQKLVERYYPGIDIGVIGIFKYYYNMYQHTVELTGLKPGAKYAYRVGNAEYGWWSETGTIETANGSDNVTFFHMTDPQSQNEKQYQTAWANTVKTAFDMFPESKFIVNTGDLVDYGMNVNQWQWMFDTASDELMSTYHMPVTGNHEEKDDHSTVSNFVLPNVPQQDTATGVYYSYTYNNVHVAVLNTNDLDKSEALNATQVEWLKNDMNNSDAQWKVLALHKALYSNGSHYDDDDVCAMREQLCSLIPELNIDLVLQGHDHVYMRTHSLDGNEVVQEEKISLKYDDQVYDTYVNPTGTTYAIGGCSGVKAYHTKDVALTDEFFPRAAKAVDFGSQTFSAIQIVGGVLYYNTYSINGDEAVCIDKFAISKDGSGVQTNEQPDIIPDIVEPIEKADTFSTIIKYATKVLTVAWNIFRMYFLEYAWKK